MGNQQVVVELVQLLISLGALALAAALSLPWIGALGLNGVSCAVMAGYGAYFIAGTAYILCRIQKETGGRQ